jgi:hypothetical protein
MEVLLLLLLLLSPLLPPKNPGGPAYTTPSKLGFVKNTGLLRSMSPPISTTWSR